MKISYAICVCDEYKELDTLLNFLTAVKDAEDEIVVLIDTSKTCNKLTYIFAQYSGIRIVTRHFNKDFADHKNFLNSNCLGDYIFNIDADEIPSEQLIRNLKQKISETKADLLFVPRINICLGQTDSFLKRHTFRLNEMGWINWPDFQGRIYRNDEKVYWESKLHENIGGSECKSRQAFEADPMLSLMHVKTVKKQDNQRCLYDTISDVNSL